LGLDGPIMAISCCRGAAALAAIFMVFG